MPQPKISAFFKPAADPAVSDPISPLTTSASDPISCYRDGEKGNDKGSEIAAKVINKKRSYAQYHLELGQSDFVLHSCAVCGMMYARGDQEDEKTHKAFHKNYYEGITFKGWRNERAVLTSSNGDRILLVIDEDSSAQKNKVQQVLRTVEKELGFSEGQLLHKLCKVYLFISGHRVVGCLVAEPIKTAHKVISRSSSCKSSNDFSEKPSTANSTDTNTDSRRRNLTIQFGQFSFKREIIRKGNPLDKTVKIDQWDCGAIFCEEEAVPALCGFRAIWVAPSSRRNGIASQLMDAARKSFCKGETLEVSQCAFSSPTSAGKALACSYSETSSFLVYKAEDLLTTARCSKEKNERSAHDAWLLKRRNSRKGYELLPLQKTTVAVAATNRVQEEKEKKKKSLGTEASCMVDAVAAVAVAVAARISKDTARTC
uniref:Protein CHROMOSOME TRANSMISSION FIDELITY 7 n=1 Tax=Ananas comosus var. bracteatus TaxID=296719 RepID=A0A6V7P1H5_ANACO|nr:unnamed protein product [Ananas comosus var. bracteatus]